MKKILFRKNIKFSMILSIASLISMQANAVIEVRCPSAKEVNKSVMARDEGGWDYEGTSTGRNFVFKNTEPYPVKIPLDETLAPVAGGQRGENKSCLYYPDRKKGQYVTVSLETDDAAAKNSCKSNPNKPAFFNCGEPNNSQIESKKEKK